jgi:hypothetical protein
MALSFQEAEGCAAIWCVLCDRAWDEMSDADNDSGNSSVRFSTDYSSSQGQVSLGGL